MAPDEKTKAAFGAKCALGRYADPEEISKLVFWLLSDHSTYCTGAVSIPFSKTWTTTNWEEDIQHRRRLVNWSWNENF